MTIIKSEEKTVNASVEELRGFFYDLRNLELVLPSVHVKEFVGTEDAIKMKVQSGLEIVVRRTEDFKDGVLELKGSSAAFKFILELHAQPSGKYSLAQAVFNSELNPFLRIMIVKPFEGIISATVDNLEKHFRSFPLED